MNEKEEHDRLMRVISVGYVGESEDFAHWLARQGTPTIHPSQVNAVSNRLEKISTADVISFLYNSRFSDAPMFAMKELRDRYAAEQAALNELNQHQERE